MVNNDIRKRRLTKRESLIYDELSRKGQRIFLKMSPYKRKKLVDGVIKNLERRNYDVSEFKEDNPHSENLKKRLVMRRIKNATMGTVTKPVKTALIVKKAKDKYITYRKKFAFFCLYVNFSWVLHQKAALNSGNTNFYFSDLAMLFLNETR